MPFFYKTLNSCIKYFPYLDTIIKGLTIVPFLNTELGLQNGNLLSSTYIFLGDNRPVFNKISDIPSGLKIMFNDTEHSKFHIENYTYNGNTKEWEADFYLEVIDHFGMDLDDLIGFQEVHEGFASWWLLQHKYNHVPFRTLLRYTGTIKGKIK